MHISNMLLHIMYAYHFHFFRKNNKIFENQLTIVKDYDFLCNEASYSD